MSFATKEVKDWKTADTVAFLASLDLQHVSKAFEENGIDGEMLLDLSDEDFETDLGLKKLQIRKIRKEIAELQEDATTKQIGKLNVADSSCARDTQPTKDSGPVAAQAPVNAPQQPPQGYPLVGEAVGATTYPPNGAAVAAGVAVGYAAAQKPAPQAEPMNTAGYTQARELLQRANQVLGVAAQKVGGNAKVEGVQLGVDLAPGWHREGLLGHAADAKQKHAQEEAAQEAQQANGLINQARGYAPDLPYIPMAEVKHVGGMIVQGVFDDGLGDAVRIKKMKESIESIKCTMGAVQAALQFLNSKLGGGAPAQAPGCYPPAPAPAYGYPQAEAPDSYRGDGGMGGGMGGALAAGMLLGTAEHRHDRREEWRDERFFGRRF